MPSQQELMAEVERLKAALAARVGLKVSTKGAVSVYGLGQFPTTLYRSQWERIIPIIKDGTFEKFMEDHADELAIKA